MVVMWLVNFITLSEHSSCIDHMYYGEFNFVFKFPSSMFRIYMAYVSGVHLVNEKCGHENLSLCLPFMLIKCPRFSAFLMEFCNETDETLEYHTWSCRHLHSSKSSSMSNMETRILCYLLIHHNKLAVVTNFLICGAPEFQLKGYALGYVSHR